MVEEGEDGQGPKDSVIEQAILEAAIEGGKERIIRISAERDIAARFCVSRRKVQKAALRLNVVPERYLRNLGTIGVGGQLKLLESSALVVGAGGLGGYLIEGLTRMGVGRLRVVDGDTFDEHNLNRQLLATEETIGRPKAEVAAERARAINGAVEIESIVEFVDAENVDSRVAGVGVVLDGLDNIPSRLILQAAAQKAKAPFIHGAIAGFYLQVMTILPGDQGLLRFYNLDNAPSRGVETELGNPAATPMACAAFQVQEAIKALLGLGVLFQDRLLTLDSLYGYAEVQELPR